MKVLILADVPGWIVDRITDRMIAGMPTIDFTKGYYSCMETQQILAAAADCDMVHYQNWDIERHWPALHTCGKPILLSIRSFRFPPYVRHVANGVARVHVINPVLRTIFPGSHYIPDGVMIDPTPLRVGFAGKPGTYKGTDMIEAACQEIGAEYVQATDLPPTEMPAWFRSIDVYCCASELEGFGAPVMEALALNKPVVSTRVGVAWRENLPGVTWVERTVPGIKAGLLQHWPARYLQRYTWPNICNEFRSLYRSMVP